MDKVSISRPAHQNIAASTTTRNSTPSLQSDVVTLQRLVGNRTMTAAMSGLRSPTASRAVVQREPMITSQYTGEKEDAATWQTQDIDAWID